MDIDNDTPEQGASLADTLRAELSKAPPPDISEEIIEDGPNRDEVGRFAQKPEQAAEQAPPEQVPDQPQGVQPPASWSKEDRAVFQTLPPNVQELLSRREREMTADYTRKTQEIAEIRRFSDEIRPVFEKNQQLIAHAGAPPAQVMDQLLGMYGYSQRDPLGYLKWAAESLGVDLSQLNQAPRDEYVDPAFNELRNQLTPLSQQVQSVTEYIQEQQRLQQEQAVQQVQSTIETFAQEKDTSGQPLRPYFEQVKVAMGRLLQPDANGNALANDLQDAYDKATWADPAIRAELQKPKAPDETVKNAKQVAAMNVRSSGGASAEASGSLRDTLRDEMARMR